MVDKKEKLFGERGKIVSVTQTCFPRRKAVYASIGRGARGRCDAQSVGAERVGVGWFWFVVSELEKGTKAKRN